MRYEYIICGKKRKRHWDLVFRWSHLFPPGILSFQKFYCINQYTVLVLFRTELIPFCRKKKIIIINFMIIFDNKQLLSRFSSHLLCISAIQQLLSWFCPIEEKKMHTLFLCWVGFLSHICVSKITATTVNFLILLNNKLLLSVFCVILRSNLLSFFFLPSKFFWTGYQTHAWLLHHYFIIKYCFLLYHYKFIKHVRVGDNAHVHLTH